MSWDWLSSHMFLIVGTDGVNSHSTTCADSSDHLLWQLPPTLPATLATRGFFSTGERPPPFWRIRPTGDSLKSFSSSRRPRRMVLTCIPVISDRRFVPPCPSRWASRATYNRRCFSSKQLRNRLSWWWITWFGCSSGDRQSWHWHGWISLFPTKLLTFSYWGLDEIVAKSVKLFLYAP